MKLIAFLLLLISNFSFANTSLYDFTINDISGKEITLSSYKGKLLLLFNMATRCGYTPQLEGLEKLNQKYKDKGLVILAIPSNDFGGQAPESNAEIAKFSQEKYHTSFDYLEKVVLKKGKEHRIFSHLIEESGEGEIKWNFEKFLIGKDGRLIKRFSSQVSPLDQKITKLIEQNL